MYSSRGVAQAKKIKEQTTALFAGGELSEEDQAFQDTYFYSLDNSKAERRANTFAAELLLAGDDVLQPIGYYEFNADRIQMEANMPSRSSAVYRAMKYQELLQEFLYTHGEVLCPEK